MASTLPVILCVDDEPEVLEGLTLTLRRRFEVLTAPSGPAALELVAKHGPTLSVIVSDMRMPVMNGAALLAQVRERQPDIVRVLLTGHTDLTAAISAVNDGQIFRFLTKPCLPLALIAALEAAVQQRRLVTAERVLLEQTLQGSIKALVEVLALASPAAFGRATRTKELATALMEALALPERWQVEVAAMLAPLGHMTWPADTIERVAKGASLTAADLHIIEQSPGVTDRLLQHIPRLEGVREILVNLSKPPRVSEPTPQPLSSRTPGEIGARVLRVATDAIALEAHGQPIASAVEILRSREAAYDPQVLTALEQKTSSARLGGPIIEVALKQLRERMVFAEDVRMTSGTLLISKGSAISGAFLERLRNFQPEALPARYRVTLPLAVATKT